jgi:hypothetical protein
MKDMKIRTDIIRIAKMFDRLFDEMYVLEPQLPGHFLADYADGMDSARAVLEEWCRKAMDRINRKYDNTERRGD